LEIFPSIDIKDGKVVRLIEGDFKRMSVYGDSPEEAAERFAAQGARNLHVVDLDGSAAGRPVNDRVIGKLCSDARFFVEVGGGVRDAAAIGRYLEYGAGRVILGTAAVRDFDFVNEIVRLFGAKIAIGVDARDGRAAVSAWRDVTDVDAFDFCEKLRDAGAATAIYTDIARDGRLRGANLDVYRRLVSLAPLMIVASGGVSFESEIAELAAIGVYGAILGKALYEKKLSLPRALAIADGAARPGSDVKA